MNEKLKNIWIVNRIWCIAIGIAIVFACVWLYADRTSRIDTRPIQHATTELHNAGEYNRQSIEYNQRVRDSIITSESINQRATTDVERIIESTQGTATRIDRSQELVRDAKQNAVDAKRIVGESRSILENARARTEKSTTGQP